MKSKKTKNKKKQNKVSTSFLLEITKIL